MPNNQNNSSVSYSDENEESSETLISQSSPKDQISENMKIMQTSSEEEE